MFMVRNMRHIKSIIGLLLLMTIQVNGQSIKKITYRIKDDSLHNPILKIEEFDLNGNLMRKTDCLDEKCKGKDVDTFIYNSKGLKIMDSTYTTKYGYHQLITKYMYQYDIDGNLIVKRDIEELTKDSVGYAEVYKYSNGHVIREEHYPAFGKKPYLTLILHDYNALGQLTSKTELRGHDTTTIDNQRTYLYDESGNLLEEKFSTDENGELKWSSSTEYEYDSLNRLTQERWLCCENTIDSTNYAYDEHGRLLSEMTFPGYDGESWSKWFVNSYDEQTGLLIQRNHFLTYRDTVYPKQIEIVSYEYY